MKIAICICTYNRQDLLAQLMRSLQLQEIKKLDEKNIYVIIVDNTIDASASGIYSNLTSGGFRFPLLYIHEPRVGLSFARNRAFVEAKRLVPDAVLLIDDDEFPCNIWIETLIAQLEGSGAAAVIGPLVPIFGKVPPEWAIRDGFYSRILQCDGDGCVKDGYTSNAAIRAEFIQGNGNDFDLAFNSVGGEDTIFFRSILDSGGRLHWSSDAVVYDNIPPDRIQKKWLLLRWMRTGYVEAHLSGVAAGSLRGKLFNLARGFARVVAAMLFQVARLASFGAYKTSSMQICFTLMRGIGLILSAVGYGFKEYSSTRYRKQK